jgi:hypothetical protein
MGADKHEFGLLIVPVDSVQNGPPGALDMTRLTVLIGRFRELVLMVIDVAGFAGRVLDRTECLRGIRIRKRDGDPLVVPCR